MKKFKSIILGAVLVAVGVIFALNALGITNIDVFFDGWWTLFIIVPCFVCVFTRPEKFYWVLGVASGVFLLLCCQGVLEFSLIWKLGIPLVIVAIGCKMIFRGFFKNKSNDVMENIKNSGVEIKKIFSAFSGVDEDFSGEKFYAAEITALFGGVTCDLRNAFIDQDCVIKANAIFGGVDIFVPDGVNVKVNSISIFGGADNKKHKNTSNNSHTIFVNAYCLFGGLSIK